MKKWLIISIGLIIIISLPWLYFHKSNSKKKEAPFATVKKGTIVEKAQAIGYIKPRHYITVKSQINGTVAEIYHEAGDYVTKGEKLIKVNPTPSPIEYATAREELESASTVEKSSINDLKRFQKAMKIGLISQSYTDYIAAKRIYETSKLQRTLAEQKLALLEKGTTVVSGKKIANIVTSPIDGYVLSRNVDVGDPVISLSSAQSATSLFSIANMHELMFQGVVDEMDASKIHITMPATITVGSMPDKKITGVLTRISLQSDKENQAQGITSTTTDSPFNVGFQIEVTNLKIPQGLTLRSGYSATANIVLSTAKDVLLLPEQAIRFKNEKPYVLLPQKNKKPAKKQPIIIGLSDGINIEIKGGLKLGDKVLLAPTED
jgi:HlyD family secretion protein